MVMSRQRLTGLLLPAAFLVLAPVARAGQTLASAIVRPSFSTAGLAVSATLRASASLVATGETQVLVTEADVKQGFVDTTTPWLIQTRSHSQKGYLVVFRIRSGTFSKASVAWDDRTIQFGKNGAFVRETAGLSASLSCRLWLDEATVPGTYDWPLSAATSVLN